MFDDTRTKRDVIIDRVGYSIYVQLKSIAKIVFDDVAYDGDIELLIHMSHALDRAYDVAYAALRSNQTGTVHGTFSELMRMAAHTRMEGPFFTRSRNRVRDVRVDGKYITGNIQLLFHPVTKDSRYDAFLDCWACHIAARTLLCQQKAIEAELSMCTY